MGTLYSSELSELVSLRLFFLFSVSFFDSVEPKRVFFLNTLYSSELSELVSLRLFFINALYSTPTLFQSSPERDERPFFLNALYLFTTLFQSSTASSSLLSSSSSRFLFLFDPPIRLISSP